VTKECGFHFTPFTIFVGVFFGVVDGSFQFSLKRTMDPVLAGLAWGATVGVGLDLVRAVWYYYTDPKGEGNGPD
jgi:hypothetical protein